MRAQEFINEGEPKVLPIIPDNMPFGANQFKDPTGTFKGGGMSSPPQVAKPPPVQNVVVPPPTKAGLLTGRVPTKPEDVTHAYRNMSPAELAHARETGYFQQNPNPGKTPGWSPEQKFWSSGDEKGHFGRDWKNGSDSVKVRLPVDQVPADIAANASKAHVLDKTTGEWMPVISGITSP